MKSNFKVYKQILRENLGSLEARENLVRYNSRLVYVKCVPCLVGAKEDRPAYAYLCRDLSIRHELEKHLVERAEDQNLSEEEIFDAMQGQGLFMLVSSRRISKENLLPLYYTRGSDRKNLRTVQAGWQDSSPECGDRSNLPRTSDDDVYECSHTETDVRQIEKDISDNSVHVYESP